MSTIENKELTIPEFRPDVPRVLMAGLSDKERYMFEQSSIQRQQNEWIIRRLAEGHRKMADAEDDRQKLRKDMDTLIQWKTVLTSKGAVVALIVGTLIVPLGLLFIGALISNWVKHAYERIP